MTGASLPSATASVLVTEPFDYTVGVWSSVAGTHWTTLMGSSSGTGWGSNNWFSHSGAGLTFGIATGGHTGTFADSTGLNYVANGFRERAMDPAVHGNTDGDVTWQYLTVSITGTGTAGQLATQNSNGGGDFAVRVEADGTYTLSAEHGNTKSQTSTIPASLSATAPDVIVVKMENQTGTGLFDVSLWVNPTATTEAGLPAPDLQILGATPFAGNRNLGGINLTPGAIKMDEIIFASDYTAFGIGSAGSPYGTWAAAYAGSANAPANGDYNNDGVQTGIAYFMGENGLTTNPGVVGNSATWPRVGVVASFEVQVSNDLEHWLPATSGVDTSDLSKVVYTFPHVDPKAFCRLVVTP